MSEVHRPVEEQPAAPVEATPLTEPTTEAKAEEVPVLAMDETTAAEPVKEEEPALAAEAPAATTKAVAPKNEFAGEGILGYKAPGGNFMKKLAGFQKKYFWFGTEPVHSKSLSSYLRGEKQDIANHNAAWSSQTGKGLLYYSKFASEKATPAGIINLADISDISVEGTVEFFFIAHGAKHLFQATNVTERESWIAALKTNSIEAKEMAAGIKNSDGYKEQHNNLSKPTTAAPVALAAAPTGKEPVTKKEEKTEAKDEKKELKEEKKEIKEEKKEEKTRKSRSASRKRNSIFGGFGLGSKKDEPVESKEEKKIEAKEAAMEAAPAETATTEPTESTAAPLDAHAVAAAVVAAPLVEGPAKSEVTHTAAVEDARPAAANKRSSSIFGTFSSKFGQKKAVSDSKSSEVAPAVPAKDIDRVEPVSAEAPVIPAPEASEPLAAAVASPATAPVTEVTNGVTKPEEVKSEIKPETKMETAQKRKSSLPFGLGASKEKKDEFDGEKPKSSPFAKLRQTIKGRTSPRAAEKGAEKTEEAATEPAVEASAATTETAVATDATEATTEPVVSEPISAAPTAAHQVSATA